MFLGLRTVIYPAPDLAAAKSWFAQLLGVEPYFDQPFYVGFDVGGYELGLQPDVPAEEGPTTYWGVANADEALATRPLPTPSPRERLFRGRFRMSATESGSPQS